MEDRPMVEETKLNILDEMKSDPNTSDIIANQTPEDLDNFLENRVFAELVNDYLLMINLHFTINIE